MPYPSNAVPGAPVGGVPIVVVRQLDGSLRALVNACRHRGAPLVGLDSGDRQLVRRQTGLLSGLGHRTEVVEPADIEPRVSTRATAGAWLPDEPSVDPRSVVAELETYTHLHA